ncbi:MAG: 30S ribosomal protein S15 [Flavobacteriales bacterium]|nr:30S ribosomal protein S15 [Flavobacteriales bacterium]|tara:strand:+ start:441 stop:710 length:270 start_codon:yes stop_codon:yes gene_type:complete
MAIDAASKEKIFNKFGKSKKDTGSVFSQVALFTERITSLTDHLKNNRKDFKTQRSLQLMVGKRRKLLDYLKRKDVVSYRELVKKLKLRR